MSTWIPISERMPTREDADEQERVVWRWADCAALISPYFDSVMDEEDIPIAWLPLPRYTSPAPGPTDEECDRLAAEMAKACWGKYSRHKARDWFADVTARIEREKPSPTDPVIDEREACAKIAQMVGDKKGAHSISYRSAAWEIRDLIRGRGANRA